MKQTHQRSAGGEGTAGVTLRQYDPERDADRIGDLVGRIWQGGGDELMEKRFGLIQDRPWAAWQARSVGEYLRPPGARAFVAERAGETVGFCSYVVDDEKKCGTVGYNGVAPSEQGRGLGSLMMAHVLEQMRDEGMLFANVIVADNAAHAPARRVYEKYGFQDLLPFHVMARKL